MKRLVLVCVAVLGVLTGASLSASAENSSASKCSTPSLAESLIALSDGKNKLVEAVARSVVSDPVNCVASFCVATQGKSDDVKVAIGAGLSDAFSRLIAKGKTDAAANLLNAACDTSCDGVIATAFAASQASTVSRVCQTALGGAGGTAPSILQVEAASGGGGQAASKH